MKAAQCTRLIQFCSGHRVVGHEGHCRFVHGHNYVAEIHAEAQALDQIGRVIDFRVLKERVGGWVDENWDHAFVAKEDDPVIRAAFRPENGWRVYWLPTNPTAENMAAHLLNVVCPKVLDGTGVVVTRIILWETQNCYATAQL